MKSDRKKTAVLQAMTMAKMVKGIKLPPTQRVFTTTQKIQYHYSSIQSSTCINYNDESIAIGNVIINDGWITSDNCVTSLPDQTYLIWNVDESDTPPVAHAKVNGVEYHGREIKVNKDDIVVDGFSIKSAATACYTMYLIHHLRKDSLLACLPKDVLNLISTKIIPPDWGKEHNKIPLQKRIIGHFFKPADPEHKKTPDKINSSGARGYKQ